MPDCKGPCVKALTPDELFSYISRIISSQVTASTDAQVNSPTIAGVDIGPVKDQGTGTDRTVTLKASPGPVTNTQGGPSGGAISNHKELQNYQTPAETITATQLNQRIIRAVAIILAESGGIPNAYNTNVGGSAPGSHDRGLPQWNDVAFSWITDLEAFAIPETLTYFYFISHHFANWGPWKGSRGLDNTSEPYKTAAAADKNRTGIATPADDPLTGAAVSVGQAAAALDVGAVIAMLGKVLATITTADFWRRFGVGALGVLLIIAAVAIIARA